MASDIRSLLYLQVTAEADPGALARVIERFQNLNIVPQRIVAERATAGELHVEVQLAGIGEDTLSRIATKLSQVPCVLNAYWHS